ncbi:4-diphosphocytidyl-2-C-methyl-D-erythritol kinase [Ruminococcaceae bacterium YRB3002]|nr:4-diphosphocytidyl-2-C-methyl-D-erythritol kinase [Ruminococcaceae bacterium YRB3002]
MESYEISANAKINLLLRICGKLDNGYHKLYTVMHEVDITDDITIDIDPDRPSDIVVICEGMEDIDPKKNLCYKACDRFYARLHKKLVEEGTRERIVFPYTEIRLVKRIPSQAGMGGGSSDAAAVILALQDHFVNPFDEEELNSMAVNVGADVPFFLYGGTCLCEGVGEVITVLDNIPKWPLLIVKPPVGVSTPRCFAEADRMALVEFDRDSYRRLYEDIVAADGDADRIAGVIAANRDLFVNDLQAPGISEVPVIADIIRDLEGAGALLSLMTGSGSAVFGIFRSGEDAARAEKAIKESGRYDDCAFYRI